MPIPLSWYRDPPVLDAEMKLVFGGAPLPAAPSALLPGPGCYATRTLPDGRSVVVSRDESGRAHVLVNACRHRGAQVAAGSGCAHRFSCPYHGWAYDASGRLASMPGKPGFDDRDPGRLGLAELPSEERLGFVWCRLQPGAAIDLDAHLGEFAQQLAAYPYADYTAFPPMEVGVAANWKCLMEAFYETYHFPFVHKNSLVGQGTIANIVSLDTFGPHARLGVPLASMRNLPDGAVVPAADHVAVLFYVYPNLVIANSPIGCELIEARPAGEPGRAVLRHIFLSSQDAGDAGLDDYLTEIRRIVRDEDGPVIDSSGAGIGTALHEHVVIGRNEPGCQHIHRQIQRALHAADR